MIALAVQLAAALFAQPAFSDQVLADNYVKPTGRSELKINAVRDLAKRFGYVDDVRWSNNQDFMRATFTRDNIKHMIDYDQKGRWVSTIRVYDEKYLVSGLRKIVKSNYIDFFIVKVIEIQIGKSHVHFIKLENHSSLLTLHIMNGEITEIENYGKG